MKFVPHEGSHSRTPGPHVSDQQLDVYRRTFDPCVNESVSVAVVEALAAATGRSVTEVGPLSRAVNSDALDELFTTDSDEIEEATASVTFDIHGLRVTVREGGMIEVRSRREDLASTL